MLLNINKKETKCSSLRLKTCTLPKIPKCGLKRSLLGSSAMKNVKALVKSHLLAVHCFLSLMKAWGPIEVDWVCQSWGLEKNF